MGAIELRGAIFISATATAARRKSLESSFSLAKALGVGPFEAGGCCVEQKRVYSQTGRRWVRRSRHPSCFAMELRGAFSRGRG